MHGESTTDKKENIKMKSDNKKFKADFKKRLYSFALDIISLIDKLPNDTASKRIGDQLLRSGTSIIGNYVEGQASSSRKEFTNFLHIALKSANESKVWLCLLRDSNRVPTTSANVLLGELEEISKILASSILTLKGKKSLNF